MDDNRGQSTAESLAESVSTLSGECEAVRLGSVAVTAVVS